MTEVILDITTSLDGFVTAPNDGPERGLGDGGEVLHYWVFGRPWTYENLEGRERTMPSVQAARERRRDVDQEVLDEAIHRAGAIVVGRRMYDVSGAWGGRSPFGPCVVVTHRVDEQPEVDSGFEFVTGLEAAIDRATVLAAGRPVGIGGGADVAQQALNAGLVDELHLHVAPVILGAGRRLFSDLVTTQHLECTGVRRSAFALHLSYRVLR